MARKRAASKKTPSRRSRAGSTIATRLELIRELERVLGRGTRVITYINASRSFLGTNHGPSTRIAEDAVRLIYDHIRAITADVKPDSLKIAIFIVSGGGDTAVPWRIASMIREVACEFNVLVPYNAMSAATMIALGADHIFMGPKGELGPIDPSLERHPFISNRQGKDAPVGVEDLTNYIDFVKNKFGIRREDELVDALKSLTDQISPLGLGLLNRQHAYIRMVGQRLLDSRNQKLEQERVGRILASLIEEVSYHGHGISRKEAREELGLHVANHKRQAQLDDTMWRLYETYERDMAMREPIDLLANLGPNDDVGETPDILLGAIESRYQAHVFEFKFRVQRERKVPEQIQVQFQLPPGFDPGAAKPADLQKLFNHLAQQITPAVQAALRAQSPIVGLRPPEQIKAAWRRNR